MPRQYSGTLGKVANCQIGVSVHAVTDAASCPLNRRLFVPESWDDTAAATPEAAAAIRGRRVRAGLPDTVRHLAKWRPAPEMLDELAGWGLPPPAVVADAGYGNNADFRVVVTARGSHYDRGIPQKASLADWLTLLRDHTPRYEAQPWQQLAAVHRAAGHKRDARRILIAQQDDRRRQLLRPDDADGIDQRTSLWAYRTYLGLLKLVVGYGSRPGVP